MKCLAMRFYCCFLFFTLSLNFNFHGVLSIPYFFVELFNATWWHTRTKQFLSKSLLFHQIKSTIKCLFMCRRSQKFVKNVPVLKGQRICLSFSYFAFIKIIYCIVTLKCYLDSHFKTLLITVGGIGQLDDRSAPIADCWWSVRAELIRVTLTSVEKGSPCLKSCWPPSAGEKRALPRSNPIRFWRSVFVYHGGSLPCMFYMFLCFNTRLHRST